MSGNWRKTQPIVGKNHRLVTWDYFEWGTWSIAVAILGVLNGVLFFFSLGVIIAIIWFKRELVMKLVGRKLPSPEDSVVKSHIELPN